MFSRRVVRRILNYLGFPGYPLQHVFVSLFQCYPISNDSARNSYFLALNFDFLSAPIFGMCSTKNVSGLVFKDDQ